MLTFCTTVWSISPSINILSRNMKPRVVRANVIFACFFVLMDSYMTTLGGEGGYDEDCQTTFTFRMLEMLGKKEVVDTSPKINTMSTQNGSPF